MMCGCITGLKPIWLNRDVGVQRIQGCFLVLFFPVLRGRRCSATYTRVFLVLFFPVLCGRRCSATYTRVFLVLFFPVLCGRRCSATSLHYICYYKMFTSSDNTIYILLKSVFFMLYKPVSTPNAGSMI